MSLRLQSRTLLFRQECPQCFPFRPFPYHAAWQHAERLCISPLSPRTNVGRVSIVKIHFISSPQPFDTPQCEIGSDGGTSSTPRWRPSNCSLAPLRKRRESSRQKRTVTGDPDLLPGAMDRGKSGDEGDFNHLGSGFAPRWDLPERIVASSLSGALLRPPIIGLWHTHSVVISSNYAELCNICDRC